MDIGSLRDRIEYQKVHEVIDSFGQPNRQWVTFAKAWANVQEVASAETVASLQLAEGTTLVITVRYNSEIKATHRVKFEGRYLGLTGKPINPDGKKVQMLVGAREWKE